MPQLNPAPWFMTLLISWVIIFSLLKLMLRLLPPQLPNKTTNTAQTNTWLWTWQ